MSVLAAAKESVAAEEKMQKPHGERSKVIATHSQVSTLVHGEAVILGLNSGTYYSLDPVGTFVWNLVQVPCTMRSIRDSVMEQYDVDAKRCEVDLQALVKRLADEGLVIVTDE